MKAFIKSCLIIILLLSGCKKNVTDSIDEYSGSVIWPLAVGNSWTYNILGDEGDKYTISISGSMEKNGFTWYYLNENNPEAQMFRNDEDGLWSFENGEEVLLWKYPAQEGEIFNEKWEGNDLINYMICVRTNTTYRQYDSCYLYKFVYGPNNANYISFYLKPDIGLVGQAYFEDSIVIYMDELTSYNLE